VLAALNIASECHKLQQAAADTEAAIGRLTERLDAASGSAAEGAQRRAVRNG
jgi:cell division protein ZapA (FtsZ GTPase activity inhibitor)